MVVKDGVGDEQVEDMNVSVVTFSIEWAAMKCFREIRHSVVPLFIINQVMVEY